MYCGLDTGQTASPASRRQAYYIVGSAIIQPATVVRDLGICFDAEMSMPDHVASAAPRPAAADKLQTSSTPVAASGRHRLACITVCPIASEIP
jgi:hypothetical protein